MSFSVSHIDQSVPTISPIPPPFSPLPFTANSEEPGRMAKGSGPFPDVNYALVHQDLESNQDEN